MTKAELEALIDAGDVDACITAFDGMAEGERAKLGATAVARLRELTKGIHPQMMRLLDGDTAHFAMSTIIMDRQRLARFRTARAAVLATTSYSQWQSVKSRGLPPDDELFRIVTSRRPEWLDQLVEYLCDQDEQMGSRWPLIRQLVREGYCDAPRSPRYIDKMLQVLPSQAQWARPGGKVVPDERKDGRVSLKDMLLTDPGLLEQEIWRIFETEPGPGGIQLFTSQVRGVPDEKTWDGALVELASEGRISRERLLDATLDGLSRDLHEMRARWFARLHDRLEPTLEERAARAGLYIDLLGSRNASTVGFALAVIKDLVKAGRVEPRTFVDLLAKAVLSPTKGTVKQALKMLELAIGRTADTALKARAVVVATEGLVHDVADIQSAILDFIEHNGDRHDRSLRDRLTARRDAIAVSLRSRIDAWLLDDVAQSWEGEPPGEPMLAPAQPSAAVDRPPGITKPHLAPIESENHPADDVHEFSCLIARTESLDPRLGCLAGVHQALAVVRGERSDCPALTFDGAEIPRLDPRRRLEPIDDLDSLVELCSQLIESAKSIDDIDRCVEAISRLCDQRPADFDKRTAPLAARIRKLLEAPSGMSMFSMQYFGAIVRSWLTGEVPDAEPYDGYRPLAHYLMCWAGALARRVANRHAAPWLAAPTHSGGWIDPRILVKRFRQRASLAAALSDEPLDLILAILRLAPDHRSDALADARDLPGEPGAAIRHALGGEGETIGPTAALWVAAARARSPWSDDQAVDARHPGLGPDAGRAAVYQIDGRVLISGRGSTAKVHIGLEPAVSLKDPTPTELPTVALHCVHWFTSNHWPGPASLWPSAPESFCASAARPMIESSEASSDWLGLRGFLLPLLDPDFPLRPMARLLLATGLNVKLPDVAGLATDAVVAAIDDGRLDADTLGESLGIVWQSRTEEYSYGPRVDPYSNQTHRVPFVKPSRWVKALGDVARASTLHARIIARAIEIFLATETAPDRAPASLLPFLELLREASVASGRAVSADAQDFLSGLGTSGKTGRVVKDLLALRELPESPALRAARMQALTRRIERAERWMAWGRAGGEGDP
jgi:hypothetical protein